MMIRLKAPISHWQGFRVHRERRVASEYIAGV